MEKKKEGGTISGKNRGGPFLKILSYYEGKRERISVGR